MENQPQSEKTSADHNESLIEVLQDLRSQIKKQNSLKTSFVKGAIYGLGTVVGATILVALFGGVIATAVNIFPDQSVIETTTP